MCRTFFVALLSVLLLAMEQQAPVHELSHVGDWLHAPQDQGLQMPHEDGCAICALFAGAAGAVVADAAAPPPLDAPFVAAGSVLATRAVSAPTYYSSRAPPVLL
jgi:hypothetical protein